MSEEKALPAFIRPGDMFARRHIGPTDADAAEMLAQIGCASLDELVEQTIPAGIRLRRPLATGEPLSERELSERMTALAGKNRVLKSCIGLGYSDCIVPAVIQRNVLENPAWYTQYTAYQAEIAQGRLESLLNFQTLVADLCALPLANASLLDEATAAAEAMHMAVAVHAGRRRAFFASDRCHPQTLAVLHTRARALGVELSVGDWKQLDAATCGSLCGALVQYPTSDGEVLDYGPLGERLHQSGALLVVATDLLALTLLRPPGEFGADIAVGSAQRFGVPLGFGGPHAAFFACRDDKKRLVPGRIIGVSRDARGKRALRMALQTREQHIRREKATSNICTAQVLLAVMASFYAIYHGPQGLRAIAERVAGLTRILAKGLALAGLTPVHATFFDTLRVRVKPEEAALILSRAERAGYNLRSFAREGDPASIGIALDETSRLEDVAELLRVFAPAAQPSLKQEILVSEPTFPAPHARLTGYLEHEVFNRYHSEHELLRYMHRLQSRDLSLVHSMIPLGSCTMKLNATSEMLPLSLSGFSSLHPFAPQEQAGGYLELFQSLERALAEITGFAAVSLQPNAGSQGEYAGLLVIRAFHENRGESQRNVCMIPVSAHGTNPASAVMAGMVVVPIACDAAGNIDVADLRAKAAAHAHELSALMVTYPSTHGVFEESIQEICRCVHEHGGQVYMDGANMNAQVGLCRPADFGADVCHLNLHKTFCIPHGGGGPGMGPIAVAPHLAPFLPGHPLAKVGGERSAGAISAAPWGSASILTISYAYIAMMGSAGLKRATQIAILNANYMATRLSAHFPLLYKGRKGRVGHEFILDLRAFEKNAGVLAEDIAKRLMDYGFHAPTMSFPVAGTLMIEPTESETRQELDRFCEALISIRAEIAAIEAGRMPRDDNPLKNAPHTADMVASSHWSHPYSREQAAYPAEWVEQCKFWPSVARVDNGYGDKNLVCTCPPVEAFAQPESSSRRAGDLTPHGPEERSQRPAASRTPAASA